MWIKKPKTVIRCIKCNLMIPETRRPDASYCSDKCRKSAQKKRYCEANPDYVQRQRRLVNEFKHKKLYGHTDFLDDPMANLKDRFRAARAAGYRSGLEVAVAKQLESLGVPFEYEKTKILYLVHENRSYSPDYVLPNGIIVETKGLFSLDDRKKHLYIKEQHPELDIRFVFTNSKAKLRKGAKMSYADWCDKNGFKYADKLIPKEWLNE